MLFLVSTKRMDERGRGFRQIQRFAAKKVVSKRLRPVITNKIEMEMVCCYLWQCLPIPGNKPLFGFVVWVAIAHDVSMSNGVDGCEEKAPYCDVALRQRVAKEIEVSGLRDCTLRIAPERADENVRIEG